MTSVEGTISLPQDVYQSKPPVHVSVGKPDENGRTPLRFEGAATGRNILLLAVTNEQRLSRQQIC